MNTITIMLSIIQINEIPLNYMTYKIGIKTFDSKVFSRVYPGLWFMLIVIIFFSFIFIRYNFYYSITRDHISRLELSLCMIEVPGYKTIFLLFISLNLLVIMFTSYLLNSLHFCTNLSLDLVQFFKSFHYFIHQYLQWNANPRNLKRENNLDDLFHGRYKKRE